MTTPVTVRKVKPEKEYRSCPSYAGGQCKDPESIQHCRAGLACCFECDPKYKQYCIWKCKTTNIPTLIRGKAK
jgi:hypothetical protein